MPLSPFPARLHVLLSRSGSSALVIRRGPAKRVCTFAWDRSTDTFALGQWLHGRIYERRSDLSPDGKYFIYFAMNGHWKSEVKGAWTAISRAPYLKAVVLLPKGDCWHGGGLFTGTRHYWLNDGYGHERLMQSSELVRDDKYERPPVGNSECLGVYFPRLLRDGWQMRSEQQRNRAALTVFEKPLTDGWVLRKFAHATVDHPMGKGCYYDEHELEHGRRKLRLKCADWDWADLDRDRLVWASGGKLFAGRLGKHGLGETRELRDFNADAEQRTHAPY